MTCVHEQLEICSVYACRQCSIPVRFMGDMRQPMSRNRHVLRF